MKKHKWIWISLIILFILIAPTDASHVVITLVNSVQAILMAVVRLIHQIASSFNLH